MNHKVTVGWGKVSGMRAISRRSLLTAAYSFGTYHFADAVLISLNIRRLPRRNLFDQFVIEIKLISLQTQLVAARRVVGHVGDH